MIKENICILYYIILLVSCSDGKYPHGIKYISSKTIAYQSESKACPECEENTSGCCVMRIGGKRFIKNQTYEFDSTGNPIKVYDYTTAPQMGALGYEITSIPPEYDTQYRLKEQHVKWMEGKMTLIDMKDSVRVFKHFPADRVIMVVASDYTSGTIPGGNVVVYTYVK